MTPDLLLKWELPSAAHDGHHLTLPPVASTPRADPRLEGRPGAPARGTRARGRHLRLPEAAAPRALRLRGSQVTSAASLQGPAATPTSSVSPGQSGAGPVTPARAGRRAGCSLGSSRKAGTPGDAASCKATAGPRPPRLRAPRATGAPRPPYLPLLVPGPLGRARAAGRLGPRAVDELQQVLHAPVVHHALRQRVRLLGLLLLPLGQPQAQLLPHLRVVPAGRRGWRLRGHGDTRPRQASSVNNV